MIRNILIVLLATITFLNLYPAVERFMADGYWIQKNLVIGIASFAALYLLMEGRRFKKAFDDIDAE